MPVDTEARIADLLARAPRDEQPDALCEGGNQLVLDGEEAAALACFDRALRLDPKCARAWASRAQILARRGRMQEAVTCLDRALDLAPHNSWALVHKGDLLAKMDQREEALDSYAKALKSHGNLASTWLKQGTLLAELGRMDEALSSYDRALALDDAPDTWRAHGDLLLSLGRLQDAAESYERVLALDATDASALHALGRVKTKLGEFDEASRLLQRFVNLAHAEDPRVRKTRAWLAEVERRNKAANAKADSLPPDGDPAPLSDIPPRRGPVSGGDLMHELDEAQRLFEAHLYTDALQGLDRVVSSQPRFAEAWLLRGRVLMAQGQLESAALSLLHAANAAPRLSDAWRLRTRCLLSVGRNADALEAAQRLRDLEPDLAEAWLLVGKALVSLDRKSEAIEALDRATDLSGGPTSPQTTR